jgi:GTP-binding protein Era
MIRERILAKTREEIPYTTGVVVESFREEKELVRIEATVFVERENHKGILIGRGGAMLKAVGSEARKEIEAFLGTKVYLGLFVKVSERWRESASVLQRMGFLGTGDDEG